jgi:alcohol dehydrogenase class IV
MPQVCQSLPEIVFGPGALAGLGARAASLTVARGAVLLVADPHLAANGAAGRIADDLAAHGMRAFVFSDFHGEPKARDVARAASLAREAGATLAVGIGGGSALDIAKVAAFCATSGADPMDYAENAAPLPQSLPKILIPTTAGAGSETSGTCIFSTPEGNKTWVWSPRAKPDLVILDPELTVTLPPALTAWCGMDAFVHAFEACTNRNAHLAGKHHGHAALRLITSALTRATTTPGDLAARGDMLWGATLAGAAIDNCGTAIAHNISHALASLAPVHHGLATALAFEATLPWLIEADTPDIAQAAHACGLARTTDLPAFVSDLMEQAGVARVLPASFADVELAALAAKMRAPENAPMRRATIREVDDAAIDAFAGRILALAPAHA